MKYKSMFINYISIVLFFYAIFGECINFPYDNYIDELITLIICFLCIKKHHLFKQSNRYEKTLYVLFIIFVVLGILSTVIFQIQTDLIAIVKDVILFSKFFICYVGFKYLLKEIDTGFILTKIKYISKFAIVIFFTFGIISLFFDIGMGESYRYGIRCYQFLFPHYTFLVYSTCICISAVFINSQKKDIIYVFLALFVMLLTLRTKAFLIIGVIILLMVIGKIRKKIGKIKYLFTIPILLAIVASIKKIITYVGWGKYNLRTGLHVVSMSIAIDNFPLGSGFGSFGSNISREYLSPIYDQYGLIGIQGFNMETIDIPVSDVFWPYILGQWGVFGLIIYCLMLLLILFDFLDETKRNDYGMAMPFIIIYIYFIIASFAEAIFTNTSGVTGAFILALYYVSTASDKIPFFKFEFLDKYIDYIDSIIKKRRC